MGLDQHVDTIAKVAEVAGKEFSIEQVNQFLVIILQLLVNSEVERSIE